MKRWPEIVILLITPPPIDEDARLRHRYIEKPLGLHERTNEAAGAYAQACISVAKEYICPLVDLWIKMQECPDWKQAYLIVIVLTKRDGLHLTQAGNMIVFEEVVKELQEQGISVENFAS
ncbi:GDSL esterase/lipase [Populus alba x Populus x berolinensis]|nr:GDSL esterase/lipase [Populus alba x Populus x berolinensis]